MKRVARRFAAEEAGHYAEAHPYRHPGLDPGSTGLGLADMPDLGTITQEPGASAAT